MLVEQSVNQKKMVQSPKQHNIPSEHKKALRIRSQRIHQRDWIINQKRRSYSTNLKPTRLSSFYHQRPRSEFKFGHELKSMRKDVPLSNQLEDIPKHVNDLDLEWNSFHTVLDTVSRFRKLLSREYNPPIDEVIDCGAVQYFVQYLDPTQIEQYCQIKKTDDEPIDPSKTIVISKLQLYALQLEVDWCISNIVSGTSDHVKYIVEMGCVPLLINLLKSEDCDVRRQCAWTIGNIGGDSEAMIDYLIGLGAINHLIKLMEMDLTILTIRNGKYSSDTFYMIL